MSQSNRAELLTKTEQWKSVGFPQLNDSLFVILTYFFERLLPEYFDSESESSEYTGAINPVRIGRRKDFWNRLTMGYQDLLIQKVLRDEKRSGKMSWENITTQFLMISKKLMLIKCQRIYSIFQDFVCQLRMRSIKAFVLVA